MTMREKRERLSAKIKRLDEASTIAVITNDDKTAEVNMQQISSLNSVVLHIDTPKIAVALFAVNAALRVIDEIEAMNCYFGFIKTRLSFVSLLAEAMKAAGVAAEMDICNYGDDINTLIDAEDLKTYRDQLNTKKWLLMDMTKDIQPEKAGFAKVGNYYVPIEQLFAVGIDKSCVLSSSGLSIEVELNVTDIVGEADFTSRCMSFYDAIKFNVADMVLDLN